MTISAGYSSGRCDFEFGAAAPVGPDLLAGYSENETANSPPGGQAQLSESLKITSDWYYLKKRS